MDDNCVDRPKLITDSYREDRYEVTAKLAYEHWEKKGRPLGSPDVDWYAAEATLREYLAASGIEIGPNVSTAKQDDQDKAPCESPARLLSRSAVPARNGKLFNLLAALAFVTLCPRTIPLEVN